MRLTARRSGIISYAGLDRDALWAAAKRAFAQPADDVPERFASLMPLFPAELIEDMSYIGDRADGRAPVSPLGFSTDPYEYHQKLCEERPELYVGDNYRRNFNYDGKFVGHGAVTVDEAWATRFAQYQPFMGERLRVYPIGGGHQAVAVPESLYPRGGAMLRAMEERMRVTARCAHYAAYVKRRLDAGARYIPAQLESEYLGVNGLQPVTVTQDELSRVMQDLSILRELNGDRPKARLFTENARRAEGVAQYAPYRCACDCFAEEAVTGATARLMQLYFEDDGAISDLWLKWQDACEYVDRRRGTLDVGALCKGFQLPPDYDPENRRGRYPPHARVAAVRDRELRPMVASVLNNPAYGSGTGPQGEIHQLVYLRDSRELLRQGRLKLENVELACENAALPLGEYRDMAAAAATQELKGRLIDAMYRRESALKQMEPGTHAFERARALLDAKVAALEKSLAEAGADGRLSGYDADIDYLRRMARAREQAISAEAEAQGGEGAADGTPAEAAPFQPDALREACIESGYAMRNNVRRAGLSALEDEARQEDEADGKGEASQEADASQKGEADNKGEASPEAGASQKSEADASQKASAPNNPAPTPNPDAPHTKAHDRPHPPERFEQLRMFATDASFVNASPEGVAFSWADESLPRDADDLRAEAEAKPAPSPQTGARPAQRQAAPARRPGTPRHKKKKRS